MLVCRRFLHGKWKRPQKPTPNIVYSVLHHCHNWRGPETTQSQQTLAVTTHIICNMWPAACTLHNDATNTCHSMNQMTHKKAIVMLLNLCCLESWESGAGCSCDPVRRGSALYSPASYLQHWGTHTVHCSHYLTRTLAMIFSGDDTTFGCSFYSKIAIIALITHGTVTSVRCQVVECGWSL